MSQVQIGDSPVYRIERKMGEGFLQQVYVGRAISPTSNHQAGVEATEVAIKFEHKDYKGDEGGILNEWKVYEDLGKSHGIPLPQIHYKGQRGDYYVTVMDLLGPSLLDSLVINWRNLPLEAIACIAVEAISILQKLHSRGYIHGDIKPDNFLLGSPGTPEEKKLFLTGLGSATRWRDRSTSSHIKYNQTPDEFRGTIPFASVHTQLGRTSSRRNDLESLVYVLVYLIRGHLPWQRHEGEDKASLVCKEKMATPPYTLCGTCPEPYLQFATFVLNLKFNELPHYARYISLFHEIIGNNPYVWPVHTGVSQEVAYQVQRKRVRLNDDEDPSKLRMGLKLTQWISVYDMYPPTMRQRYFSNLDYADLLLHIEKGHEEGMYITSVAYSSRSKSWAVVMDNSIGYTAQIYTFSCGSLPKEWIGKKWSQDFYITAVAGADDSRFLVIMSKGLQSVRQAYIVASPFPFDWIKKKWAEGLRVTSMATYWRNWAVVVSKGTGFTDQAVELDLQYPAEGIRERWKQGYYITSVAATSDEVAFIFSKIGGGPATASVKQETLLTFDFPGDSKIEEERARDSYISSLCYGRTIA
ncbi:casein kinase 1-like protein HD16 [Rhodamnia argentea]|uniref:non-specific serine/threonine protein kinase n=1 Tax=Rhodamnia argentea TaxID=178133 RepID=A0ABM3HBZ1_9MYRT|nr:casein kinase 1-like protein HD16 [Rhodamnia argentea]